MTPTVQLAALWMPVVTVHITRDDIQTLLRFAELPRELEERLAPERDGAGRYAWFDLDSDELTCLDEEAKRFSLRLYADVEVASC